MESIADIHPRTQCHYYRNVLALVPQGRKKEVATMLKAIHAQENMEEATKKKEQIARKLSNMKFGRAAELVRSGSEETLSYYGFPA